MMFGLNGTLTLALSFSLVKSLCGTDGKGMDYNLFWRRSLAAATACRSIGSRLQLGSKEDLFLTGLIQDIGMLALDQFVPDLYQEIGPQQGDHLHVQNVERETLSTDHAAVGAWLLQRWNLPERWVQAVAGSHDFPEYNIDPKYEQLARCVMLSGATADIVYHENRELASFRARKQAQRLLGVNRETLVSVLNEMVPELQGTAALFDVYLMDSAFVDSILDRAQEILNLRNL